VSGKYGARLSQLEATRIKPPELHVIMSKSPNQPKNEVFDSYMLGRMAQGYTPPEGWHELRTAFMSDKPSDSARFIYFQLAESIAPKPPIVTNHREGM